MYLKHLHKYTQESTMADIINPTTITPTSSKSSNIKTFRFEFSKEFITELSRFSKVHQYDERHTYKKEWSAWKSNPEIAEIMEMEKRRLEENGYVGDIEDKMFKSGRYYFRKKTASSTSSTLTMMNATTSTPSSTPSTPISPLEAEEAHDDEPHTPSASTGQAASTAKHRKPYITMSKPCIRMMDAHIKIHSAKSDFKPSLCYDNFYNEKMSSAEMALEIDKIIEKYENARRSRTIATDTQTQTQTQTVDEITNEIMDKIKKTYKNRYYRFVNNSNHKDDNDDE